MRNFTGATGNISWDWTPTGVTSFNVSAGRQVGAQEYILANYVVTRTFGLGPRWSPTAKVSMAARIDRTLSAYGGDPKFVIANLPEPRDALIALNLSLQYVPQQFFQLNCSVRHEQRTSNVAANQYNSNVTTVTAQLKF
jgi:hypothetical protein